MSGAAYEPVQQPSASAGGVVVRDQLGASKPRAGRPHTSAWDSMLAKGMLRHAKASQRGSTVQCRREARCTAVNMNWKERSSHRVAFTPVGALNKPEPPTSGVGGHPCGPLVMRLAERGRIVVGRLQPIASVPARPEPEQTRVGVAPPLELDRGRSHVLETCKHDLLKDR